MNLKKSTLAFTMLGALIIALIFFQEGVVTSEKSVTHLPPNEKAESNQIDKPSLTSNETSSKSFVLSSTYQFHERLKTNHEALDLYQKTKKTLGDSAAAEQIALYVAGGLYGTNDTDFTLALDEIQNELNRNAGAVSHLILQKDTELKNESFIYQMILNLAANLQITSEQKAQLLGQAMKIQFEAQDGEVSAAAANITNAFILMKSSGLTLYEVESYISQGLAANSESSAREEFTERIRTYYPEYFER